MAVQAAILERIFEAVSGLSCGCEKKNQLSVNSSPGMTDGKKGIKKVGIKKG